MSTKFTGAWEGTKEWLKRAVTGKLTKDMEKQLTELAMTARADARRHIIRQDLGWLPLKPATAKRKGSKMIYVETGDYYNNIQIEVQRSRFKTRLTVGPTKRRIRDGQITYQELASYLEYGTSRIPPRPLWNPTFRDLKENPKWRNIFKLVKLDFNDPR